MIGGWGYGPGVWLGFLLGLRSGHMVKVRFAGCLSIHIWFTRNPADGVTSSLSGS